MYLPERGRQIDQRLVIVALLGARVGYPAFQSTQVVGVSLAGFLEHGRGLLVTFARQVVFADKDQHVAHSRQHVESLLRVAVDAVEQLERLFVKVQRLVIGKGPAGALLPARIR